ncbi:MFS transporter [Streptomyces sp. NRRL F-5630]|uniref:MFS transporter n=1 Tax=Streptomyces sp. NRRL F-5630 TaxID=1463864 RepID=UPI003D73E478
MKDSAVAAEQTRPAKRTTGDLARAAVSGWLGTAMEFMDFQLYSLAAAIVFNKLFFPDVSPAIGLIAAMATYGVGYVARLGGAVYFGRMGDRLGRKKVLYITVLLMGASTTLIGVLPTYGTIGIMAPILLVALRLAQGFGAGAEIAGATVLLAEYAPAKRRGLISSLVSLGTNSGTLAASGLWAVLLAVLSEDQLLSRGLAAAVPAQLRHDAVRRLAASRPEGEPRLRGTRRRRGRCGAGPRGGGVGHHRLH